MNINPNRRKMVERNDGVERAISDDPSIVAGPEDKRNGARKADIHEDWLSLATADPSLWLRDADL